MRQRGVPGWKMILMRALFALVFFACGFFTSWYVCYHISYSKWYIVYGFFGFAPKLCFRRGTLNWFKKPQITLMLASQALRSCSRLEHALAYRSRNASLSSRCSDLLRKPFSLAQGSSKLSPITTAQRDAGLALRRSPRGSNKRKAWEGMKYMRCR